MKIQKSNLLKFLELVMLSGDRKNQECKLEITDKRIMSIAMSPDSTAIVDATLKISGGEKDTLGIDNLPFLVDVVKSFKDDEIKLEKKANKLILSQGKQKASILLRDEKYIRNWPEAEKLKTLKSDTEEQFDLTEETVKEILSFLSAFKSKGVKLSGKDNKITIFIESNENSFEKTYDVEKGKLTEFSVKLGSPFIDILNTVKGSIVVKTPLGRALEVFSLNDDFTVKYYAAMLKE